MAGDLGGRPTKYRAEMCDKVVEMMKEGASKYEVALDLDLCEDTFYEYIKVHKEFSEAVKKGEWFSKGQWFKMGRINLNNKEFNSGLWFMNMKNRHGWADRQDNRHEVNVRQEDAIKALG